MTKEWFPPIRALVKEQAEAVFQFVSSMISDTAEVQGVVVSIFREFGGWFAKRARHGNAGNASLESKIELFRIAWEKTKEGVSQNAALTSVGRDLRLLRESEKDLLSGPPAPGKKESLKLETIRARLLQVDPEFRGPVILRDFLKMDHEEVAQVLRLRWGVYRHRLHRGRLDLAEALSGT